MKYMWDIDKEYEDGIREWKENTPLVGQYSSFWSRFPWMHFPCWILGQALLLWVGYDQLF